MKLRAITRTTVDTYLRLARLPVEIAISVLPDGGTGFRSAALAGLDRTDAFVRTVFGVAESPARQSESPEPVAPPAERPTSRRAVAASARTPTRRMAKTKPPERPRRESASEATPRRRDEPSRSPSHEAPQPSAHEPAAPSQEAIAARAYELYKRGVPGDPDEHWQIAERELHEAPPGRVGV